MAGADETVLRQCVQRIRQEPDREQLETILALFAMITMDSQLVARIVRWSMTILEKSPIYQEIWHKGEAEGLEKGLEKARQSSMHTLKLLLHQRLGPAPLDLPERLARLNWEQLQSLLIKAGTAAAWPEFLTHLAQIETGTTA